jgi:HlyD family secretion protein
MNKWLRRAGPAAVAILVVAGIVYGFWPRPVEVDLAEVARGPMRVTVDEEGKTRVRERYVVSAPLGGSLLRVQLKAGAPVVAGRTVLAVMEPSDPAFLDARERAEVDARVKAAGAAADQAMARLAAAQTALTEATEVLGRVRSSRAAGAASIDELQSAEFRERMRAAEVRAAEHGVRVAVFEQALAEAARARADPKSALPPEESRLELRAPVDGKVLRVFQESAAVLTSGTKILEVGDPADLEIVIEMLSIDAARVAPGNRVVVERWGGDEPLAARVRLVEPSAFMKVSALGVEEQRVNVIADFIDPPEKRKTLYDAFRVETRTVIWEADEVVKVPAGALFRAPDGGWAVFAVRDGRARLTPVEAGRSNGVETEALSGLVPGEQVVLHPSDGVKDGVRVVGR